MTHIVHEQTRNAYQNEKEKGYIRAQDWEVRYKINLQSWRRRQQFPPRCWYVIYQTTQHDCLEDLSS